METETFAANATGAPTLDAAYARITWRLIPFLALLWIIAWIDRVNIGFAKLQMLDDLKFSEAPMASAQGFSFWDISCSKCRAISF